MTGRPIPGSGLTVTVEPDDGSTDEDPFDRYAAERHRAAKRHRADAGDRSPERSA